LKYDDFGERFRTRACDFSRGRASVIAFHSGLK
jgi:hypothetical protein